MGRKYGHSIRENLNQFGGLAVAPKHSIESDIYLGYKFVVYSGKVSLVNMDEFTGRIILLNPCRKIDMSDVDLLKNHHVTIVLGALDDWRGHRFWTDLSRENSKWQAIFVDGSRKYLSDWPDLLLGLQKAEFSNSVNFIQK